MMFVKNDNMRQALSPNRTDDPLNVRILPGRARRNHDFFYTHVLNPLSEKPTVNGITIANQEPRRGVFRECLDDLLSRPLSCGVRCYIEVDNFTMVMP
jgi:hypothetical protein